jgi:hypothetical protein
MAVPETVDLTQLDPEEEIQRRLAASLGPAARLSAPQIAPPGKPDDLMARPGEPDTPQAIPNATIKSGETWRDKVTPLTAEIALPTCPRFRMRSIFRR